jgi:hypothetical protein
MADIYGVVPADVIAELPELFPQGFATPARPTDAQVVEWISTADATISLRVYAVTGTWPDPTDKAAPIARQYIISWVKGKVMQAIYAGRADEQVKAVSVHYFETATDLLEAIADLGAQATGEGIDVTLPFDPSAWLMVKSLRAPVSMGPVS